MEIEISKIGERGQIVIPKEIRERLHIKSGEKFFVVSENGNIIIKPLKKVKSLDKIQEDIIDMQIAEKAWKEIEQGKYEKSSREDFLKEMGDW